MRGARRAAAKPGQLLGLDADAAARVEGQIRTRRDLAARAGNVLGRVERELVRGGDPGLLSRYIDVIAWPLGLPD